MEKFKDVIEKLFKSDIKSVWAWVAGGFGVLLGSKLDISIKPKQKKEVTEKPKSGGLMDKLKAAIKEEQKEKK